MEVYRQEDADGQSAQWKRSRYPIPRKLGMTVGTRDNKVVFSVADPYQSFPSGTVQSPQ